MAPYEAVLDASALLALLHSEPGGEVVEPLLDRAAISSVNWSEVAQKSIERGRPPGPLREDLEALGLQIVPFTTQEAEMAAHLREGTRHLGLSLGDRACLATAITLGARPVTADQRWRLLDVGTPVQVVR